MAKSHRKTFFNIPNILTYSRIALIPVVVGLMMAQSPENSFETNRLLSWLSAAAFIVAGVSDLVDGYYARKYAMVSVMGKFIDPMADKLIHMAVMVQMIPMGRLPAWLVIILLFREILITGIRSAAVGEGLVIAASDSAKKKTAWLNVGLGALLVYYPIMDLNCYTVGWVALAIGSYYSLWSGAQYVVLFVKQMMGENK